jgi:hypothetical protein
MDVTPNADRNHDSASIPVRRRKTKFDGTKLPLVVCPSPDHNGWVVSQFEIHCHMVALYAVWYNFIRIHKTLRVTPAMQAGVTDRLFSYDELIGIVDEWEASQTDTESA